VDNAKLIHRIIDTENDASLDDRVGCIWRFSSIPSRRHKKTPPKRGFSEKHRLDNLNFLSLHAFLTTGGDERDLLAFFQALEAFTLDGTEVNEEVVTGLRSDEAEAFFIVEPLNGTGLAVRHLMSP